MERALVSEPWILASWNVNGIRSVLRKEVFYPFLEELKPDILCVQETKAKAEQVELELDGYDCVWNSAEKAGYSGTLILSKREILSSQVGLGKHWEDNEGRVLTVEYSDFFLVNVYTPNAQRDLTRLDHRMEWDAAFLKYLKQLEKKKPVVFCGDLNVSHKEIDLANPKSNRKNAGFTDEERSGMDSLIAAGFVDTFRLFNQEGGNYSWWSYRNNARERNIGWRLDYFLVSKKIKSNIGNSWILPETMGSDHCPVALELTLQ